MRIFLAGATGALGQRLVPLLVDAGHQVVGTTHTPAKAGELERAGAQPVVVDGLDRDGVLAAVTNAAPDVVIHQMTALGGMTSFRHFDKEFALTNRLRTEGVDHLLDAARQARAQRFIVQSYTGWPYARTGGPVKTEEDPLDDRPAKSSRRSLEAIKYLERVVTGADDIEGVVLRYGGFYGPATGMTSDAAVDLIRKRRFPIIGAGNGITSFIDIEDAATATAAAVDHGASGLYNVVDDEPAPAHEWLPFLARTVGAKPPRRMPAWVAKPIAGEHVVLMMTAARGASNAKAKSELGWTLRYPSWRQGFPASVR